MPHARRQTTNPDTKIVGTNALGIVGEIIEKSRSRQLATGKVIPTNRRTLHGSDLNNTVGKKSIRPLPCPSRGCSDTYCKG